MKKLLLFSIPMSICNMRCHYCYLAQRPEHYQGIQPEYSYTPEQVARALRTERLGGLCYMNFCADGETLLVKNLDSYVLALVKEGHYAEIVTNLTVNSMLDKILSWDKELLKRVEFKCSFHYIELKKRKLLDRFTANVKKIWDAGASANIEVTPSDELIPLIDELKAYSMEHFGALPHLTIARDDRTAGIDYLTKLPMEEYDAAWSQFDSSFWEYKKTIFGVKQKSFCYAGVWQAYIDLYTGKATGCYGMTQLGNVFENPDAPFPEVAVGKCRIAHCYNGHMLLTQGLMPDKHQKVHYGDIRDKVKADGTHWLQPELQTFFNGKCVDENSEYTIWEKTPAYARYYVQQAKRLPRRAINKVFGILKRNETMVLTVIYSLLNVYSTLRGGVILSCFRNSSRMVPKMLPPINSRERAYVLMPAVSLNNTYVKSTIRR